MIANPGIRRIASLVTPRQRGVQPRLLTLTAAALERSTASPAEQVFACTAIGGRYSPEARRSPPAARDIPSPERRQAPRLSISCVAPSCKRSSACSQPSASTGSRSQRATAIQLRLPLCTDRAGSRSKTARLLLCADGRELQIGGRRRAGRDVGLARWRRDRSARGAPAFELARLREAPFRGPCCPTAVAVAIRDRAEIVTAPHQMRQRRPRVGRDRNDGEGAVPAERVRAARSRPERARDRCPRTLPLWFAGEPLIVKIE